MKIRINTQDLHQELSKVKVACLQKSLDREVDEIGQQLNQVQNQQQQLIVDNSQALL